MLKELRHYSATVFRRCKILRAQHRLRHRDASATLRIYSHAMPLTDSLPALTLDGLFR
ncbi:MAG: hypothetical protein L0K86_23695 [Actinomycetia bacterium]|nr:hypothetical protein [Actinomycetes bacterium]